jgi:hypothetical protein
MYIIPIDDYHYHINELTDAELSWGTATYARVLKRYPDLKKFISDSVSPLNLNHLGEDLLLRDITLAFCHGIKHTVAPNSQEQCDKTVKAWLYSFLPYLVENLKTARYSHPVQLEPIPLSCHYLAVSLMKALLSVERTTELSEFEGYLLAEFVGLFRAIRASLALLSIGDDVHAASVWRGILEISAKLALSARFSDEYVLFKKFNAFLQCHKINGDPLPKEMSDYFKNEPACRKSLEAVLAYGWARNSDGNRILTMKELVEVGLNNKEKLCPLLHLASEFVHEDHVGVGYDYVALRKKLMDHCYITLKLYLSDEQLLTLLPPKDRKRLRHLQTLADPIYSGEIPLSCL